MMFERPVWEEEATLEASVSWPLMLALWMRVSISVKSIWDPVIVRCRPLLGASGAELAMLPLPSPPPLTSCRDASATT